VHGTIDVVHVLLFFLSFLLRLETLFSKFRKYVAEEDSLELVEVVTSEVMV
jgi:hypothetical protein